MSKKSSFTLLELVIVVIVLAIIASFVIPGYWGARRRVLVNEADGMLTMILTAQKVRHLEAGEFLACANNAKCNAVFDLDLPAFDPDAPDADARWLYSVTADNDPDPKIPDEFCAQALRGKTLSRHISYIDGDEASEEPLDGACP